MGAGAIDRWGKCYNGQHTGSNLYKYNYDAMPGALKSKPKNKDLTEGRKVKFVGKNKKFKNTYGVVQKMDKKYGRSLFPVNLERYDKKTSTIKTYTVYCNKSQLRLPLDYKDPMDAKVNELKYKRMIRQRKRQAFSKQKKTS
jgi:hypothetical protein